MGTGASASARPQQHNSSKAAVKRQLTKAVELDLERERDFDRQQNDFEERTAAEIRELKSKNDELVEKLLEAEKELKIKRESLEREQNKALALMFNELPLSLLSNNSSSALSGDSASLSQSIPSVAVAWCDVVGFASLVSDLLPQEAVNLVDQIHALYDEAFSSADIFIMERSSDGCVAVCGIQNAFKETQNEDTKLQQRLDTRTPISLADSCYETGDEAMNIAHKPDSPGLRHKPPEVSAPKYAAMLAAATLNLMSMSAQIEVPGRPDFQLQLRVALHVGQCIGGVVGLQTSEMSRQTPKYKLLGSTMNAVQSLCMSSLALQIRVSKSCRDLLHDRGGFLFERCPDQQSWHKDELVESYWLMGQEGLTLTMPALDKAVSLSEYDNL